jgi:ribosome-associated protein
VTSPTRREEQTATLSGLDAAHKAIDVASDRQATDILLLDVREVTVFADFMVIMSGGSVRQLNALASELDEQLAKSGMRMHHREGTGESGWVLLDFGDVVVHIFSEQQRDYYRLEDVWKAARQVVRIQ